MKKDAGSLAIADAERRKLLAQGKEILARTREGNLDLARIVWELRRGTDCKAWLHDMGEMGLPRRDAFRLGKIGEFLEKANKLIGAHGALALADSLDKLELLAGIPLDELVDFLGKHAVAEMDREELRDAVAEFLGRERRKDSRLYSQRTFWDYGLLPDPEKMLTALSDEVVEKLDYGQERLFVGAFRERWLATALLNRGAAKDGELRRESSEFQRRVEETIAERKRRVKKVEGR